MKKIKLILICDTKNEIDDQFAISYALKSPEIDLLGVVSTQNQRKHGPESVDIYHQEAKKIIRLAKARVPCFRGSRSPIVSPDKPERSAGVDFIIEKILHSKEKVLVASTGPATDLANAILLEPRILNKAEFIWHGGFLNQLHQQLLRGREVNFVGDKTATQILLDSEAKITLLPVWGVTESLILNSQLLADGLKQIKSPLNTYLAHLLDHNWERLTKFHFLLPKILKRYWALTDVATIAVVKNYAIEKTQSNRSCRIEKGKFSFDSRPKKNFRIIEKINAHKILTQLESCLLS